MAMRLATEYVKTCMQLTEAEMAVFIQMFVDHEASLQVKVFENGNQEVVFQSESGQELALSFEKQANLYVCQGTCRLTDNKLVNLMRKAVSTFKGDAVVHRIYSAYTMVYTYKQGAVVKIVEQTNSGEKVVFEYKNTIGELEQMFKKNEVEQEIGRIKAQINSLLDLRNVMQEPAVSEQIDGRLQELTHRLFVLEA